MRKTLLMIVFTLILCTAASASEIAIGQEKVYEALPKQAAERMGNGNQSSFADGLMKIVKSILPELSDAVSEAVKGALYMLCTVLLCAIAGGDNGFDPAVMAGIVCITSAGMLRLNALASAGVEALQEMQTFADILLPAMTAGTAAAGGITASTAIYAGTALFSDLLMHVMGSMLLPVIYAYVALRAAQVLCASELLNRLAKLIQWCFQAAIKLILFIFTGYLSITGLVAGSADATLVKAAKLALSGVVPVVGGMISDASETVLVGAEAVRNAVGIFGLLAVIAICIGPFMRTAVQFLVMKAASVAAGAVGQPRLLTLIDAVCEAMGFLLAILAAAALMLLISCICYLKVNPA